MSFKFSMCDECIYYNNFEQNHLLNQNYAEYMKIKFIFYKKFNKIHIINKIINYYSFSLVCDICKIVKLCFKHSQRAINNGKSNEIVCDTCYWWGIV